MIFNLMADRQKRILDSLKSSLLLNYKNFNASLMAK
jgi:hypothetical protein